MHEFDFDCLQRKRLAQQARHRKRGSKSRKCPLSTDHMTIKQWEERCGKIVTIGMDKPVSWDVFKQCSRQTQEEYIKGLMTTYGANATSLAAMFGIQPLTVRRYIASRNLDIAFPVGHSMNTEQRNAWDRFLHNEVVPQSEHTHDNEPEESPAVGACERPAMNMKKFAISFSGNIDVAMISNSLIQILGDSAYGEVEITCNLA